MGLNISMSWRNSKLENVYSFVIFFSPKNNMGTPKDDQNEKNTLEMGFLEYQKRIIGMSHISHCFYFQISFWQKESQSYDLFGEVFVVEDLSWLVSILLESCIVPCPVRDRRLATRKKLFFIISITSYALGHLKS